MLKNLKRVTSMLLVLSMLFSFCGTAFAAETTSGTSELPSYAYFEVGVPELVSENADGTATVTFTMSLKNVDEDTDISGVQFTVNPADDSFTIDSAHSSSVLPGYGKMEGYTSGVGIYWTMMPLYNMVVTFTCTVKAGYTDPTSLNLDCENVIISEEANVHLNVTKPADSEGNGEVVDSYAIVYRTEDGQYKKLEKGDGPFEIVNPTVTYTYEVHTPVDTEGNEIVDYNIGDTITAEIVLKASKAANVDAFGFYLAYDQNVLTLTKLEVTKSLNGKNVTGGSNLTIGLAGGTIPVDGSVKTLLGSDNSAVVATATFTAKAEATKSAISVTGQYVGIVEDSQRVDAEQKGTNVNIHDIQVTLNPGTYGTINGGTASVTYYAKYNETGLYTRTTDSETGAVTYYDSAVTSVTPGTTTTSYRLSNPNWKLTGGEETQVDFAALAGQTFTASKSYDLQVESNEATVTIQCGANGLLSNNGTPSNTEQTRTAVIGQTVLSDILPETIPNDGYQFAGWNLVTIEGESKLTDADLAATVSGDMTVKAVFVNGTYDFVVAENKNATVNPTGGVSTDNKVTYGTDVTFTVEPVGDYAVNTVVYTVNGSTNTITPDSNGVYTIPGSVIKGSVTVTVSTVAIHKVTFEQGTGTTVTGAGDYYKRSNSGDLYTSVANAQAGTGAITAAPTVTANTGYRLGDTVWTDGSNDYSDTTVLGIVNEASDIVLTSKAIKTQVVTFKVEDDAQGSFTVKNDEEEYVSVSEVSITPDLGYVLTANDVPAIVAAAGYAVDSWDVNPVGAEVTADVTYTLSFKDATYTLTLPETTVATVEVTDGADTSKTPAEVTHGTDVKFTVEPLTDTRIDSVTYQVGSEDPVPVTPVDGVYTIPGADIIGNVVISVVTVDTVTVKFESADTALGAVAFGSVTVDKDHVLTADDIPGTTPAAGYKFVNWTLTTTTIEDEKEVESVQTFTTLVGETASSVTYVANFEKDTYTITWPDGYTAGPATAQLGDNVTFTPALDGKIVTGVTYSVDATNGVTGKAATLNEDGTYSLDGNDIIGNVTVKFITMDGKFEHVSYDMYAALKDGSNTKVVILHTDKLATGSVYMLTNYTNMYYSDVYGGYVAIVNKNETDATLSAQLKVVAGTVVEIKYDGDVNSDGVVDFADAGDVYDLLGHVEGYEASDLMRLSCDVVGSDSTFGSEKSVTVKDVTWIAEEALGRHSTSSPSTGA